LCFTRASAAILRGREGRGAGSSGPSSSLEDKSDALSFSFMIARDPVVAIGLQLSVKPEERIVAVADLSIAGSSLMKHEVGHSSFITVD